MTTRLRPDAAAALQADPPEAAFQPDDLQAFLQSPQYQVRRVLRVTQMHWDLPAARGKRAVRLSQRMPRLLAPLRPGAFASLALAA